MLSSLLAVAAVAAADPKLNEPVAGAGSAGLAVVVPAANEPKVTDGFFCSVVELVLLVVTTVADFPNEKPVLFAGSAALLAAGDCEPKLNPLVVAVVDVTASELLVVSDVADLEPKLDPNPLDPNVTAADVVVVSFFSLVLVLSVVSADEAAGLIPKLNPPLPAGAAGVLPLLPKLNLGLSSEPVVLVVDVTEPKLKPPLVDVVALADELAGTPKENPVVFGASFPSES